MDKITVTKCLEYYQNIGHDNINRALQESTKDSDIESSILDCILQMDSIMSTNNDEVTVYRDIDNLEKLVETMDTTGLGSVIADKGFSKCSISPKSTDKCIRVIIDNTISSVSLSNEEILLQRNLNFYMFPPYQDTITGCKVYPCCVRPVI